MLLYTNTHHRRLFMAISETVWDSVLTLNPYLLNDFFLLKLKEGFLKSSVVSQLNPKTYQFDIYMLRNGSRKNTKVFSVVESLFL